jgi:hypothetical protein
MSTATATRSRFLGDLEGQRLRDDATGVYTWPGPDGRPWEFTSVTTILQHASKPQLLRWYAKQERDYLAECMQQVKLGKLTGQALMAQFDERAEWSPRADVVRDGAAERGSAVHHEITRFVLARFTGSPWDVTGCSGDTLPYMTSFLEWFKEEQPEYEMVEAPVFSREFGYAGTLDAIVRLPSQGGKRYLLDYKTGTRTFADHALQLAAYRHAEFVGIRATHEEVPMPHTAGGAILLVNQDRCKLHVWPCSDDEFKVFRSVQNLCEWRRSVQYPGETI